MTNYLLPALAPGIEKRIGGMSGLYAFLESEYNLVIEAATDFISARDARRPRRHGCRSPSSPLLVVRRITHSGGRPVEVAILLVVADKYEYCVHTKDRPPRGAAGRQSPYGRGASRMTFTARDVAQLIDISAVQAPHGAAEIRGLRGATPRSTISSRSTCCPAGSPSSGAARRQPRHPDRRTRRLPRRGAPHGDQGGGGEAAGRRTACRKWT